jgi:hypothetical protein
MPRAVDDRADVEPMSSRFFDLDVSVMVVAARP